VSFDPKVADVLQYATNFFASSYSIVVIVVGMAVAAFGVGLLINLFRTWRAG